MTADAGMVAMRVTVTLVVGLLGAVALAGCSGGNDDDPAPGLANPASEYCVSQGGQVEIVTENGGEVGYCVLPDGRRIEEWEFFRASSDG